MENHAITHASLIDTVEMTNEILPESRDGVPAESYDLTSIQDPTKDMEELMQRTQRENRQTIVQLAQGIQSIGISQVDRQRDQINTIQSEETDEGGTIYAQESQSTRLGRHLQSSKLELGNPYPMNPRTKMYKHLNDHVTTKHTVAKKRSTFHANQQPSMQPRKIDTNCWKVGDHTTDDVKRLVIGSQNFQLQPTKLNRNQYQAKVMSLSPQQHRVASRIVHQQTASRSPLSSAGNTQLMNIRNTLGTQQSGQDQNILIEGQYEQSDQNQLPKVLNGQPMRLEIKMKKKVSGTNLTTDMSEEILQGHHNDELFYIQDHRIPGIMAQPLTPYQQAREDMKIIEKTQPQRVSPIERIKKQKQNVSQFSNHSLVHFDRRIQPSQFALISEKSAKPSEKPHQPQQVDKTTLTTVQMKFSQSSTFYKNKFQKPVKNDTAAILRGGAGLPANVVLDEEQHQLFLAEQARIAMHQEQSHKQKNIVVSQLQHENNSNSNDYETSVPTNPPSQMTTNHADMMMITENISTLGELPSKMNHYQPSVSAMTRNDNKTKSSHYTSNQDQQQQVQVKAKKIQNIPFLDNANVTPQAQKQINTRRLSNNTGFSLGCQGSNKQKPTGVFRPDDHNSDLNNALPKRAHLKQPSNVSQNKDIKAGHSIRAPNSGIRSDEESINPQTQTESAQSFNNKFKPLFNHQGIQEIELLAERFENSRLNQNQNYTLMQASSWENISQHTSTINHYKENTKANRDVPPITSFGKVVVSKDMNKVKSTLEQNQKNKTDQNLGTENYSQEPTSPQVQEIMNQRSLNSISQVLEEVSSANTIRSNHQSNPQMFKPRQQNHSQLTYSNVQLGTERGALSPSPGYYSPNGLLNNVETPLVRIDYPGQKNQQNQLEGARNFGQKKHTLDILSNAGIQIGKDVAVKMIRKFKRQSLVDYKRGREMAARFKNQRVRQDIHTQLHGIEIPKDGPFKTNQNDQRSQTLNRYATFQSNNLAKQREMSSGNDLNCQKMTNQKQNVNSQTDEVGLSDKDKLKIVFSDLKDEMNPSASDELMEKLGPQAFLEASERAMEQRLDRKYYARRSRDRKLNHDNTDQNSFCYVPILPHLAPMKTAHQFFHQISPVNKNRNSPTARPLTLNTEKDEIKKPVVQKNSPQPAVINVNSDHNSNSSQEREDPKNEPEIKDAYIERKSPSPMEVHSNPLETNQQITKKLSQENLKINKSLVKVRGVSRIDEQTNETGTENYNESMASQILLKQQLNNEPISAKKNSSMLCDVETQLQADPSFSKGLGNSEEQNKVQLLTIAETQQFSTRKEKKKKEELSRQRQRSISPRELDDKKQQRIDTLIQTIRKDVVTPRRRIGFNYKASGSGNYKASAEKEKEQEEPREKINYAVDHQLYATNSTFHHNSIGAQSTQDIIKDVDQYMLLQEKRMVTLISNISPLKHALQVSPGSLCTGNSANQALKISQFQEQPQTVELPSPGLPKTAVECVNNKGTSAMVRTQTTDDGNQFGLVQRAVTSDMPNKPSPQARIQIDHSSGSMYDASKECDPLTGMPLVNNQMQQQLEHFNNYAMSQLLAMPPPSSHILRLNEPSTENLQPEQQKINLILQMNPILPQPRSPIKSRDMLNIKQALGSPQKFGSDMKVQKNPIALEAQGNQVKFVHRKSSCAARPLVPVQMVGLKQAVYLEDDTESQH